MTIDTKLPTDVQIETPAPPAVPDDLDRILKLSVALKKIHKALKPLSPEARERVLRAVAILHDVDLEKR